MVSSSSAAQPAVLDRLSLLQHLDNCLEEAYQHGSPIWHSPGQGSTQPNRPKHDFSCHNLQSGARIDMHRGVAKDDRGNVEWHKNWLHHMPRYRARLAKTHGPQSTNSCANAVEVAAGLSYAAFKNNSNLPSDQTIEFPSEEAHNAWVKVWHVFGELGLTVFGQLAHTLSANGPPHVEASCCGGAAQPAAELRAPSGNAPQLAAREPPPVAAAGSGADLKHALRMWPVPEVGDLSASGGSCWNLLEAAGSSGALQPAVRLGPTNVAEVRREEAQR